MKGLGKTTAIERRIKQEGEGREERAKNGVAQKEEECGKQPERREGEEEEEEEYI